jgi:hypothetical protein
MSISMFMCVSGQLYYIYAQLHVYVSCCVDMNMNIDIHVQDGH